MKYLVKIVKKVNFHKNFDKKYESVLEIFQTFFIFGPNAKDFARTFFRLPFQMEIILYLLIISHFSTK